MLAIVVVNQSIMAWPPPSKQPTVNPAKPFTAHFATEPRKCHRLTSQRHPSTDPSAAASMAAPGAH